MISLLPSVQRKQKKLDKKKMGVGWILASFAQK
jgi:hypothetical protein